jgi:hypothetical protein
MRGGECECSVSPVSLKTYLFVLNVLIAFLKSESDSKGRIRQPSALFPILNRAKL